MSDSKRIVKNTMYLYIKTGLTVLIALYTTRLILQSLGEIDFGIFSIVGGVISMLGFLNTSMAVTIQRYLNYEQGKGNEDKQIRIFNVGVVFHAIIAIIISFILIFLGFFLFNGILNIPIERIPAAKIIYLSLIISTAITVLTVPYDACLNAHENMLYYSIVGIIEALLKLGVAFIVVYSNRDKLITYGILMAIIPIISMTLMRIYCRTHYVECHINLKRYFDRELAKEVSSFAGWSLLGSSSSYLGNYGNMIVMNHYYGTTMNTVMGIANQIQGQLMVLSSGMLKALNPVIAKEEGAGKSEKMLAYALKGCYFSYLLFAVFAIPLFIDAPIILDIWLGQYPEWTVLFVRLQLVRAMIEQVTVSLNKTLEAKNKIKLYNLIVFLFNLIPIPILIYLYSKGYPPYWHYIIAISSMVIVPSIAKLYLSNKYCGLKISRFFTEVVAHLLIISFCSLVVCIIIKYIMPPTAFRVLVELIATFFVIIVVGQSFLSKGERSRLFSFVRTAISHKRR